jgi:hypothetical protein
MRGVASSACYHNTPICCRCQLSYLLRALKQLEKCEASFCIRNTHFITAHLSSCSVQLSHELKRLAKITLSLFPKYGPVPVHGGICIYLLTFIAFVNSVNSNFQRAVIYFCCTAYYKLGPHNKPTRCSD